MNDTMTPPPIAATRHLNVEENCGTHIQTSDLREWVLAAERNNNVDKSIARAVTLNCIRCQKFNAYRVYDCKADGCPLWPFRLKALMLDEE